ncbi:cryptochrome/photolyase family protein [Psychroflexus planctonicus]|uniref:Cryptochrome/photolyase family protein n=1 Tax=Psychroflexus planctonicus TaxID=1526575 RepID=A0ABQ1SI37_9FLAO|nr:cryptochrome/photolyase family protein [Psychroflexus planctonicus]GGE39762.1 cryptochrome/photolyase family protein [Psychroflexus planctonicus]
MKKTLRLILGDQLNAKHSWFSEKNENVVYFMAEMKQETNYVKHHIQKVVAFFLSMRNFSESLQKDGHQVIYYNLDDEKNQQDLVANLKQIIKEENIEAFEYQLPDEFRLDKQLRDFCEEIELETKSVDTEHFYTQRKDVAKFFEGKKEMTMEYFYRDMRKKHEIMMLDAKKPEGGQWNFDKSNRKKWTGKPEIPPHKNFKKNVSEIIELLQKENIETIGRIEANNFSWPTSREECLEVLDYFCKKLLVHFGDYEDAMHTDEKFLFHSRLSFAMNTKMLSPKEIIDTTLDYYYEHKDEIDISQVEGFVRQILGWREFMRGIYWKEMPEYKQLNALGNTNKLPDFYWTGKTKMNCMSHAINQSLDEAHAHHIQRLMVTGNFALLTMVDPDQVDEWYLGVYIDAIEWVELTNTRGMSQFADGGIVATKPYVSSGSYINKMSNYCKSCHYSVSKKEGEKACPFNNLYWNFLYKNQEKFKNNQRMGMMMNLLKKMNKDTLNNHIQRSEEIIKNPDAF